VRKCLQKISLRIPASKGDFLKAFPYRAVALDLDGTLLDERGNLPRHSAEVLRGLAAKGLRIILASGRMTARVIPIAAELNIPLTLISFNGAEISEGLGQEGKVLQSRSISDKTRDAVFRRCRDAGVFLNVYAQGKLFG